MFLITRLLRFSVRHPRVVITVAGAVTLCALVFIPRIQLRLDGRSLIPSNLPQFAEGDEAASRFELRDLVLIGVGNEESGIYTPETLQRIARLSDGLSRVNGVVPGSVVGGRGNEANRLSLPLLGLFVQSPLETKTSQISLMIKRPDA